MNSHLLIKNARVCHNGSLIEKDDLYVNGITGLFQDSLTDSECHTSLRTIEMGNRIVAPAFIELQTNGCLGVHFTNFENERIYRENLQKVSRFLAEKGVGGFYVTLPTVSADVFKKVSKRTRTL